MEIRCKVRNDSKLVKIIFGEYEMSQDVDVLLQFPGSRRHTWWASLLFPFHFYQRVPDFLTYCSWAVGLGSRPASSSSVTTWARQMEPADAFRRPRVRQNFICLRFLRSGSGQFNRVLVPSSDPLSLARPGTKRDDDSLLTQSSNTSLRYWSIHALPSIQPDQHKQSIYIYPAENKERKGGYIER